MKISILKVISLLCLLSLCLSLVACTGLSSQTPSYKTRSATVSSEYFNTRTLLSSYGDVTDEEFDAYVATVSSMLGEYHKLFDIYNEYDGMNNVMTVNKNAGIAPVEISRELFDFLSYCKELYPLTDGKCNVMFGSVLKIWHDAREEATKNFGYLPEESLPTDDELTDANRYTSIELLVLDADSMTAYISNPNASLDVGAIAKGYAAAKIAAQLKADGADSFGLNAGGNLVTIGLKPNGENWEIGITNPIYDPNKLIACRVSIGETSLVTSGDYERYFMSGNKTYHHIIDPDTLMPAEYFSSVSIFTSDGALADALSTALFCMSYEEGLALVRSIGNVEVVWIDREGNVTSTEGINILS